MKDLDELYTRICMTESLALSVEEALVRAGAQYIHTESTKNAFNLFYILLEQIETVKETAGNLCEEESK